MRSISGEFSRFLLVGGVNTIWSYLLYAALQVVLPYQIAYTVAYVASVVVAYYLNARFVFRSPLSWGKALRFPTVYVAQYIMGVAALYLLVELLAVHQLFAPFLVVAATVPVTFLLSRFILKRPAASHSSHSADLGRPAAP